jgi:hypothetical protein
VGHFLTAVHRAYGDGSGRPRNSWATSTPGGIIATGPIASDALPTELAEKAVRHPNGPVGIAKSLGWWLRNRDGRWANGLTVRGTGENGHRVKLWQIHASQAGETP